MEKESKLEGNIQHIPLLLYLSQKLGLSKTDILSTTDIAKDMNFSQQTASRKMQELEELGFIKKQYSPNGLMIGLTDKATEVLKANYSHLKNIFEESKSKKPVKIQGAILSGIGEGKFYVQIKNYNEAFTKLLGEKPFPGTLNVIFDKDEFRELILKKELVRIEGFKTKERTFGYINCYKITIQKNNKKVLGFITIPERTSHPEHIAEIISPTYLRREFNLKDNDKIEIV
ncbi:CTP-dependent riboflavin kinase [Candidatus Woesearchaeota archaeon]|jgi:riboflavin kinase, archaea type|nr:CTP-dependent riboflavin kinase [Candidatus Woesearchaeota archaeon]MBT5272042.1 CTP-dependent riboflavin kinase [Candidatus Woesearchaeota archaeon]MBT6041792.1 CTP-dependent riboflavin kinase [Candidatus Woesearchaeota archaeon]MBT6336833.1 CTP-dependent riboflavin kinase [Candidatus Woesearchaeota archaeon]MBT7927632.1 CTP-dependent riboflavin kinase [Candidatus Woesearchaeota archaeon]